MSNSSEEFFIESLKKVNNRLESISRKFIEEILIHPSKTSSLYKDTQAAFVNLCHMIREEDRPKWLTDAEDFFDLIDQYGTNENRKHDVKDMTFDFVTSTIPSMMSHDWDLSKLSSLEFDFDEIFQRHRDEQKIPELFDKLADWLEKIVATGKLDSVKATNQLNQIIKSLRKSHDGSYLATSGAWSILSSWLSNSGWELLGEIPIAGAFVRGFQITLKEADEAMKLVNEGMKKDFEANILTDSPKLRHVSPEIPHIEIDEEFDYEFDTKTTGDAEIVETEIESD